VRLANQFVSKCSIVAFSLLVFTGCAKNQNLFPENILQKQEPANSQNQSSGIHKQPSCDSYIGKTVVTTLGAVGGAVIGKSVTKKNEGMIAGGVLGGVAGYSLGDIIDTRRKNICLAASKYNTSILLTDIPSQANSSDYSDAVAIPMGANTEKIIKESSQDYATNNEKILVIIHTDKNQNKLESEAIAVGDVLKSSGVKDLNIYYQTINGELPLENGYSNRVEIAAFKSEEQMIAAVANRASVPTQIAIKKQKVTVKKDINLGDDVQSPDSLGLKIGQPLQKFVWFGFATPSYASADTLRTYISKPCNIDKPKSEYGPASIKSYATRSNIKISDYKKGLYRTSWVIENANNNYVATQPVSVLKDGAKPVENPTFYVWKDYKPEDKKKKPDVEISTHVNVYEGENGILYRMFMSNNSEFVCSDIFFSNTDPLNLSKQQIRYKKNKKEVVFEGKPRMAGK
jgi:hypothetical protein